ncbi:MAG: MBL fold metallo-hydrolase [Chromatiales bacterium]|nr:MBL fold metallo-hydrolase [Chromatiales bacterium]
MKQLYDDLWQTTLEHPFADLNTHAYFLQRNEGNVLFYNTSNQDDIEAMSDMGGIIFQYLSHRHETGDSLSIIKERFKSQLCSDNLEEPHISRVCKVDTVFSDRQTHSSNIEVIPTPGHTDGGLCFYYQSPNGLRYLFTGDTFFQSNGHWETILIANDGGNKQKLVESLQILRDLQPDVVMCSASVGDVSVVEVTHDTWVESIDNNIGRLARDAE